MLRKNQEPKISFSTKNKEPISLECSVSLLTLCMMAIICSPLSANTIYKTEEGNKK